MSGGIHILKGTGNNCTCGDCSVLYGGTCYTTPINNWLDKVEKLAREIAGNKSYICKADVHKFLEKLRPMVCKRYKIKGAQFDKTYYGWTPLFYHCLAYKEIEGYTNRYDRYDARALYKRSRCYLLWGLERDHKLKS